MGFPNALNRVSIGAKVARSRNPTPARPFTCLPGTRLREHGANTTRYHTNRTDCAVWPEVGHASPARIRCLLAMVVVACAGNVKMRS